MCIKGDLLKCCITFTEDKVCYKGQWKCSNGRCITKDLLCDGEDDCDDGSDETEDVCGKLNYKLKYNN